MKDIFRVWLTIHVSFYVISIIIGDGSLIVFAGSLDWFAVGMTAAWIDRVSGST